MSKRILRNASIVGAMAAGAVLMAGGAAQAAPDVTSVGNQGVANGNQVVAPVQVPVDVCGNAVGALVGVAGAGCDGGSSADISNGGLGDMTTAGNNGIANGNQVQAPVQVPVDVCGNAVGALIGVAGAGCDGGADADIRESGHGSKSKTESAIMPTEDGATEAEETVVAPVAKHTALSADNNGIANGNQLISAVQAPISACGNAISVIGVTGAGCDGGSSADLGHHYAPDMTTAGNNGIANGNQVFLPIQAPIDISGNAVGVAGVAGAGSTGGADADLGPSW